MTTHGHLAEVAIRLSFCQRVSTQPRSLADKPSPAKDRPLFALVRKRTNAGVTGLSAKCQKCHLALQKTAPLFANHYTPIFALQGGLEFFQVKRQQEPP